MDEHTPLIRDETRDLFRELCGRLNDNILREILLASTGLKISRTCMSSGDLTFFLPIARRYGLEIVLSERKYIHRKDIGKGGWSNSVERTVAPDHPDGLFNVYVASDRELAEWSLTLEEGSDENSFGKLLGIPECCRSAYGRYHPIADTKQNDFTPLVLENTSAAPPYNFWNNYVAQYFGSALLSFFPCSFNCRSAAKTAKLSFAVLRQFSAEWATTFVESQKSNILYTEYSGLYLFKNCHYKNGWLDYNLACVQSTENTPLRGRIDCGNRLKILGKNSVEIYKDDAPLYNLTSEDMGICLFY